MFGAVSKKAITKQALYDDTIASPSTASSNLLAGVPKNSFYHVFKNASRLTSVAVSLPIIGGALTSLPHEVGVAAGLALACAGAMGAIHRTAQYEYYNGIPLTARRVDFARFAVKTGRVSHPRRAALIGGIWDGLKHNALTLTAGTFIFGASALVALPVSLLAKAAHAIKREEGTAPSWGACLEHLAKPFVDLKKCEEAQTNLASLIADRRPAAAPQP